MGGYLPWLGVACSGSANSLPARSDSKQKAAHGTSCSCQPIGSRRMFNQSASEPPGLGGLLPECSPSSTVLRRGFSLPSKRQSQVQPLDPFCLEASCAPQEVHSCNKEKLRPLVVSRPPAVWAEQGEKHEVDGGGEVGGGGGERGDEGGESDNDSIASEEWAEALWSPGRQSQLINRQELDGRQTRSLLSRSQSGT